MTLSPKKTMSKYLFRKLFVDGPAPDDGHLDELAKDMARPRARQNSTIPAGYTYLGQFVDHDISLDSMSDTMPWDPIKMEDVFNGRIPKFDMETVYGLDIEPPPDGKMVVRRDLREPNSSRLKLGKTVFHKFESNLRKETDHDLPRHDSSPLARIVDLRNDENLVVAQTHVAFIKFHNAIASKLESGNPDQKFEEARIKTIRYYQHIVLHDLLPKFVNSDVLKDVKENPSKFYDPQNQDMFVPFEYSVAAYRMGHSMVRHKYHANNIKEVTLSDLNIFTGTRARPRKNVPGGTPPMLGKPSLLNDWIINWNLFYDIDGSRSLPNFNFAFKINSEISFPLGLTAVMPGISPRTFSIPALDLFRGKFCGLATGQQIEAIMKQNGIAVRSVPAGKIEELLPKGLAEVFRDETPLWFYILAEAQINEDGERMGDIGSRLVAETFVELLKASDHSIIVDPLTPAEKDFVGLKPEDDFGMPEMLKFVNETLKITNPTAPGFLNPNPDPV